MISFKVYGQPKGKARPRFANGRVYTPKATKDYEAKIKKAYLTVSNGYSFGDKPVRISITAFFKKAKSNKGIYAIKKPDLDNIVKAVLDGLNGVAYNDDSQVIYISAAKVYGDEYDNAPCIYIEVENGRGI